MLDSICDDEDSSTSTNQNYISDVPDLVGNVPNIPPKCWEVTYISSIFTKKSNVRNIWDLTSPNLCHLARIYGPYIGLTCTYASLPA